MPASLCGSFVDIFFGELLLFGRIYEPGLIFVEKACIRKAVIIVIAKNNMVEDAYPENLTGMDKPLSAISVLSGGRGIA